MACGEFADPIYDLIDEWAGEGWAEAQSFKTSQAPYYDAQRIALVYIIISLVKWLSGKQIEDFVEDFRRLHCMPAKDCLSPDFVEKVTANE